MSRTSVVSRNVTGAARLVEERGPFARRVGQAFCLRLENGELSDNRTSLGLGRIAPQLSQHGRARRTASTRARSAGRVRGG